MFVILDFQLMHLKYALIVKSLLVIVYYCLAKAFMCLLYIMLLILKVIFIIYNFYVHDCR